MAAGCPRRDLSGTGSVGLRPCRSRLVPCRNPRPNHQSWRTFWCLAGGFAAVPGGAVRLVAGRTSILSTGLPLPTAEPHFLGGSPLVADCARRVCRPPAGMRRRRINALLEPESGLAAGARRHARLRSGAPYHPVSRLYRGNPDPAGAGDDWIQPVHRGILDRCCGKIRRPRRRCLCWLEKPVGCVARPPVWACSRRAA
jgi:hypothetical protein